MATSTLSAPGNHAATTPSPVAPGWALTASVVLGLFYAGAGVMRLLPVPFDAAMFASWGLPGWFRPAVGIAELAVGAMALRPGTRQLGLVGIGTVMTAAATLHVGLGHGVLVPALVNAPLAATAFLSAWATRFELLSRQSSRR